MKPLLFAFVLLQCSLLLHFGQASRFRVNGPVLTVTLKDPMVDGSSSSSPRSKWLNLDNIRPNLHWSFQSTSKPLPKWFPSLQSLQGTVGYHYDQMKRAPTFVEGGAKFRIKGDIELDVLPTYEVKSERTTLMLQISKGAAIYGMAKFRNMALEMIRGCYQVDLPYASVGAIRVTPTWNVLRGEPSCVLEGTTGSQRTKAVINLEYQNPTLTVVHALDDRHVIAPEISLYNARIIYQWNVALNSGSIRTKVDPTDSVHVTWTDHSTSGGKWVTDMRLPLVGASISALAADIRVRRQFSF